MTTIQAPAKTMIYTLRQIDEQLDFIAELLKYSDGKDRRTLLRKADEWLDRRFELIELSRIIVDV